MAYNFREFFQVFSKKAIQWFPGHMGRGVRLMEQKLKSVDCIVEVHDARIPLSGRNKQLHYKLLSSKPHILVLNKRDLIEPKNYKIIAEKIKEREGIKEILFTNCKERSCRGIKKIIPLAKDLILSNSNHLTRSNEIDKKLMIIGVPNVGKSSIINILRNKYLKEKSAAKVGAIAGITRSVMNKIKISEQPLIYMIDTPGILEPQISDDETGMKLALCGCFQDHLVGEELIADYLLYWLNKHQRFEYVELMDLKNGPTDRIDQVLTSGAIKLNKFRKIRSYNGLIVMPDTQISAQYFIKSFRTGYFGKLNLDQNEFS